MMFAILIMGLIAPPAVSLVRITDGVAVTAAAWAPDPLPPYAPSSTSRIPGFYWNCRRTSCTTSPPTRPTACMASDANRNAISPPMKRPAITHASERENTLV